MLVPAGTPRTVALTLDACSGAADMRIIDTLIALSVPATIFVTGLWLRTNRALLGVLRTQELLAARLEGAGEFGHQLQGFRGQDLGEFGCDFGGDFNAMGKRAHRGVSFIDD